MPHLLERLKQALADRYAVESEIGRGGMAVVFLAEDLKHGRKVAIKVLHPELAASIGSDRFLREIETVAGLNHPHVLPLHDSGETDGLLYYVMPFVEGESLGERLERDGQLPLDEAIRIAREVADGLDYAHDRGVVHRDIKPGNILLSRGHALIADFGVAKAIGSGTAGDATATGLAVGTPKYMSPEQASGATKIDGRSDVYALGCVLWEMLAGEPPFDGPTPHAILARKATEAPPEVRVVRNTVPPALENVLARAMATSLPDRFQTAGELAVALGSPETVPRVRRRSRVAWRAVAGVLLAVVIAAGAWILANRYAAAPEVAETLPIDSTKIAVLPFTVIGAENDSLLQQLALTIGTWLESKMPGEHGRRVAHPGSVRQQWRLAGGVPDAELSEADELRVARDVGAGLLVRGTIAAAGSDVVLAGRLVETLTGEIRVPTERVEGPREELYDLADQLFVRILIRDTDIWPDAPPRLTQYSPDAIQAYLAGIRAPGLSAVRKQYFSDALAADSSLVEAALWLFADGESDMDALRYAWDNQERLSSGGRAYLRVLAAGKLETSLQTAAQRIAAYEELRRQYPEWSVPSIELGSQLTMNGAVASIANWPQRAREALERFDLTSFGAWHLAEISFLDQDTVRARTAMDVMPGTWMEPCTHAYEWRLAVLRGDTAAAALHLAEAEDSSWVPSFALADGRGIADADRVIDADPSAEAYYRRDNWYWTRGRDTEWREAWEVKAASRGPLERYSVPLFRSILLGPSEDTAAYEAVRGLEQLAVADEGEPIPSRTSALAQSWISLWRLVRGDSTGVQEALHDLSVVERPYSVVGWAHLLEAWLSKIDGGDTRSLALRADSVLRERPLALDFATMEVHNYLLAILLHGVGESERALATIRRRVYTAPPIMGYTSIPEYLREEARLAAAVGDTAGALDAYHRYFTLRDPRPDHPTWAAQWDSMRVEYGALTGVEPQ